MIRIVLHLAKVVIAVVTAVLFSSCGFEGKLRRVDGNGKVTTQQRTVNGSFDAVSAGSGLEIIIEQGQPAGITVEADDNLQEHIKTELNGNELHISSDVNLGSASAKKVTVRLPEIVSLESSSGCSVKSIGTLKTDKITLSSSSGSTMAIGIDANTAHCSTSSGSSMELLGRAGELVTDSGSGSSLDAAKVSADNVSGEASSGSTTVVNPLKALNARASSGGSLRYVSTPEKLSKHTSSGGSVSQN